MTPQTLFDTTQRLIDRLRATLGDDSPTARAIDRQAAWDEIAECAQQEGLGDAASALFDAASVWWEFEGRYS